MLAAAGILLVLNIFVILAFYLPVRNKYQSQNTLLAVVIEKTRETTQTPTPEPVAESAEPLDDDYQLPNLMSGSAVAQGMVVFSMEDDGFSHLYAFSPGNPTLLRLTSNPWDDIDPAISPDGKQVAFSSRQNGYWDIYILNLEDGNLTRVTDTPEFDSSPAWSPDGTRLAFQSFQQDNMEIMVASLAEQPYRITRITFNEDQDYDPSWSPDQDQLVYISSYQNQPAIWTAMLGGSTIRLQPVEIHAGDDPRYPVYSPDGTQLTWSSLVQNHRTIFTWQIGNRTKAADAVVEGEQAAWSPDGEVLFVVVSEPNQDYLAAYSFPSGNLVYPVTPGAGRINGLDWQTSDFVFVEPEWVASQQQKTLPPKYQLEITPPVDSLPNRYQLIHIDGVQAAYPMLHDLTNESFSALREKLKAETGWDILANLESAFQPLSSVNDPGMEDNWLYTGRGFKINYIPMNVGWLMITKEEYGTQTYFRLYARPLYQDGSMGKPVLHRAWNINARFDNDPGAYERGGELAPAYPTGYWVDVTDMALRYDWERIPATPNWTTYFQGAQFNLFVMRQGLTWRNAMLELYPPDIFITPTGEVPPTATPTLTQRVLRTKTPTITPTSTPTSTLRPTWTPLSP